MAFPAYVLLGSSCYLRALLVLLRLLAISRPTSFEALHIKISHTGSIIIWTIPFLIFFTILVMAIAMPFPPDPNVNAFSISYFTACNVCFTLPILATITIYGMLLHTLKRNVGMAEVTSDRMKSLAN